MTADYFSVDRRGFYQTGRTLGLFEQSLLPATLLHVEDFITPEHLRAHLKQLFPDGLSVRCWAYDQPKPSHPDARRTGSSRLHPSLELLVEYSDEPHFPNAPRVCSRILPLRL
jgi:hypothetical protein